MKNLIVYSTMYGCTEKCANKLKEKLEGETVVVSSNSKNIPNPNEFTNVILGSSIKIGKIGKSLSKYMEKNEKYFENKRIGLFICGGEKESDFIKENFPEKLYNDAISKEYFGGEISMDKVGFITGLVLKMAGKYESYSRIEEDNILKFATVFNN